MLAIRKEFGVPIATLHVFFNSMQVGAKIFYQLLEMW
jgi:hypothetical protein